MKAVQKPAMPQPMTPKKTEVTEPAVQPSAGPQTREKLQRSECERDGGERHMRHNPSGVRFVGGLHGGVDGRTRREDEVGVEAVPGHAHRENQHQPAGERNHGSAVASAPKGRLG